MAAAKPILVGAFVLGALGLGIGAILVFGGMRLFTRTTQLVVVFPDSVAGLAVGSPVTFRGVQIGHVQDIRIHINTRSQIEWIPVYIDVEPARITFIGDAVRNARTEIEEAVRRGLRAQLISQSLVTGELSVNLDYHHELPLVQPQVVGDTLEIPTIPSDLQNLKDELRRLDLPGLVRETRQTLVTLQQSLAQVSSAIGPLTEHLTSTLSATTQAVDRVGSTAEQTLQDIDRLAIDGRGQLKSKGEQLDILLATAQRTSSEAETLLGTLNEMTDPHSELRGDMDASVRDLAATSSSLRDLTEDLARSPVRTLMRNH
jgi:paraquat-inducible protein B